MTRLSARARLTLIYASLFSIAGAALIVVSYSLVSAGLPIPSLATEPAGDQLIAPDGGTMLQSDQEIRVAVNESLTSYRAEVLNELLYKSALALIVALSLSVVLGWLVAGRVLRPLRDMTSTAQKLTHGDLGLRLPVPEPQDEIRHLAETFNGMLDRIESAFDQERRIIANLSHEIRTPLANQRVAIEVTLADPDATTDELRETLLVVANENRRSQVVSERILHLAQAQGTDGSQDEPVDLAVIVHDALTEAAIDDRDLVVDLASVPTRGDPVLLRRLVDNLLENAFKYSPPGGRIAVQVEQTDNDAVLHIVNDGPRMTEFEVNELLKPFHRSRAARTSSGVGLGLAIVAAVVQRHGGNLLLTPRDEGGLDVAVLLTAISTEAQL